MFPEILLPEIAKTSKFNKRPISGGILPERLLFDKYKYFKCFTNDKNIKQIDAYFNEGMGWGDLKKELFELINLEIAPAREKYFDLVNDPKKVEKLLKEGESKALKIASKNLKEIRALVGIKSL